MAKGRNCSLRHCALNTRSWSEGETKQLCETICPFGRTIFHLHTVLQDEIDVSNRSTAVSIIHLITSHPSILSLRQRTPVHLGLSFRDLQTQWVLRILLLAANAVRSRLCRVAYGLRRVTDTRSQARSRVSNALAERADTITNPWWIERVSGPSCCRGDVMGRRNSPLPTLPTVFPTVSVTPSARRMWLAMTRLVNAEVYKVKTHWLCCPKCWSLH